MSTAPRVSHPVSPAAAPHTAAPPARPRDRARGVWRVARSPLVLGVLGVLLYNLLFWTFLLLHPVRHDALVAVDDVVSLLGPLLVLPLLGGRPRQRRGALPTGTALAPRRAAVFLGLGVLSYVGGGMIWDYFELIVHQAPFPSWADASYLSVYPLLLVGILLLPARPLPGVSRLRVALDGLMLLVGVVTFNWYFVLGPTVLQSGIPLVNKVIGTAYPAGDLLLLLSVILLWVRAGDRALRPVVVLLSLGLGAIIVGDSIFDYQNLHLSTGYQTGGLIDPLWPVGYMLIGLGALTLRRRAAADATMSPSPSPSPSPRVLSARSLWRLLLPYAFVPAVGLLLLTPGDAAVRPGVNVGAALLIGLVLLRQVVAMRELHTLYANNDALTAANARLAEVAAQLERSNRELHDFVAGASHDLQEPLRKVRVFGDRLVAVDGAALSDRGRDYLGRLQGAAGRMQDLIRDLLAVARLGAGAPSVAPVDLGQVVRDVLSDLDARVQETGARVEVGDLPTVAADPTQMRQLFQNLLGNALTYHRLDAPPVITIRAQGAAGEGGAGEGAAGEGGAGEGGAGEGGAGEGGAGEGAAGGAGGGGAGGAGLITPASLWRIAVADNGIGFDEKYLDRIFTVFERLHGQETYAGTGIGLTMCRRIVERHGGSITATSRPGAGATFVVTLPAATAATGRVAA